jgi:hypothetical protein
MEQGDSKHPDSKRHLPQDGLYVSYTFTSSTESPRTLSNPIPEKAKVAGSLVILASLLSIERRESLSVAIGYLPSGQSEHTFQSEEKAPNVSLAAT